jgi:hypothetical protein
MSSKGYFLISTLILCTNLTAQENSLDSIKINLYETIESLESNTESNNSQFNTLYEHLEILLLHPLAINTANKDELIESQLFTEHEATQIIVHRNVFGSLIDLKELTYLGINSSKIDLLKPFISLKSIPVKHKTSWTHEWLYRYSRATSANITDSLFLGSQDKYLIKLRANQGRKIRLGLTLEKDAGEEFFSGSNSATLQRPLDGFDFSSFHLFLRPGQRISHIAIGDYGINMGQGLLIWNGFSFGKTALVLSAKRQGPTLLPYSSAQENGFMRGVAVKSNFGSISQTFFSSHRKIDANVSFIDDTGDASQVSSFQSSGLHRTTGELYDESSVKRTVVGSSTRKSWLHGYVQVNGVYTHHDTPLVFSSDLPHSTYTLEQNTLGTSLDYKVTKSKYSLFGEYAMLQSGSTAQITGIELFTRSSTNLIMTYRNYSPSYYTPHANAFSDGGTRNEKGLYLGLESSLSKLIQFSAYTDIYRRKWPSSNATFGFEGQEVLGQLKYTPNRTLEMYIRARSITETSAETSHMTDKRTKVRFHVTKKLTDNLAIRSRYEWNQQRDEISSYNGYLLYQDAVFYIPKAKLSASMRAALFNSRQSSTASYAFENDLLYSFSVPVYNGQGTRFYVMLKWKPKRKLQYWIRYSHTNTLGEKAISQIKFQTIYRL